MKYGKKSNRNRYVCKGYTSDGLLSICNKISVLHSEKINNGTFKVSVVSNDGTMEDLNMSIINSETLIYKIVEPGKYKYMMIHLTQH